MKLQRHAAILRIVRDRRVENQDVLREALAAEGINVTQATLSRDIREPGWQSWWIRKAVRSTPTPTKAPCGRTGPDPPHPDVECRGYRSLARDQDSKRWRWCRRRCSDQADGVRSDRYRGEDTVLGSPGAPRCGKPSLPASPHWPGDRFVACLGEAYPLRYRVFGNGPERTGALSCLKRVVRAPDHGACPASPSASHRRQAEIVEAEKDDLVRSERLVIPGPPSSALSSSCTSSPFPPSGYQHFPRSGPLPPPVLQPESIELKHRSV
jgi:hypothetical protein